MRVAIEIDGKPLQVESGMNLLEAALQNGIYIPHLCHHPDLPDIGSCRLCIVEVEGEQGVQPACKLTVREGMKVTTDSPRIAPCASWPWSCCWRPIPRTAPPAPNTAGASCRP